jgi:hypothetical protein
MFSSLVLTHPELGVFKGRFLGNEFWSKRSPVRGDGAVAFRSENEIKALGIDTDKRNIVARRLTTEHSTSATFEELQRAGLLT